MLCIEVPVKLTFSQWFLLKRRERKLAQEDVASALNVSRQTISNWERAASVPSLTIAQIKTLCDLLQCSLDEIPVEPESGDRSN